MVDELVMIPVIAPRADEARVNVTIGGYCGDMPQPVPYDAADGDIKQWVTEAVRNGGVPGVPAQPGADFTDFVVQRFDAQPDVPLNRIVVRPKTPFGVR